MSYTGMESEHKLNHSNVIVLKIRQYNGGKQIDYGSNWDQWSNMAEDVTSTFRFSAPIMVNQMRYPAVTATQQQQKQNTYANVVQSGIPITQMPIQQQPTRTTRHIPRIDNPTL